MLLLIPLKPGMFGFMLKEGMVVGRKRGEEGQVPLPQCTLSGDMLCTPTWGSACNELLMPVITNACNHDACNDY